MAETVRIRVGDADLGRMKEIGQRLNLGGPIAVIERAVGLLDAISKDDFEVTVVTRDGRIYGLHLRGWSRLREKGFRDAAQVVAQAVGIVDFIAQNPRLRLGYQGPDGAWQAINVLGSSD